MPQVQLPSPLKEYRSDEREVFTLVNALRRAFLQFTAGGATGLALFSTPIGRGDVLSSGTGGAEVIGLSFQLPIVYTKFTLNFAGEVADSASAGIFRIRMGGTYGVATSGTVVATINASAPGFVYAATPANVTGNTSTLVQMTLQSTAGHTAQFREGFILGN